MKTKKTQRGFSYNNFKDNNNNECSVQKSSLATEDCIWLGCDNIGLKKFIPYKGWEDVNTDGDKGPGGISYVANNRMHLNQEQVKQLLPILQNFVDTGELPE